jgi:Protein of unknown function (DUF3141)
VREQRQTADDEQPPRQIERMFSELVSASLDYYRDVRDAAGEAMFFQTYGNMIPLTNEDGRDRERGEGEGELSAAEATSVLVSAGGYAEALSRVGYLLAAKGKPLPLAQFELKKKLIAKWGHLLPKLTPGQIRVIRGNQEVICRHEPERALTTLPMLLSDPIDHDHFLTLLDAVVEEYSATFGLTEEQSAVLERIREVLCAEEVLVTS